MNSTRAVRIALLQLALVAAQSATAQTGDAARGARVFQVCAACHSVTPGEHLTGPSLAHVWNRKAGTVEGFQRYSEALKRSGIVWNAASLDKWLADPERLVPGNSMPFPGIKGAKDRADLVAYLEAVSQGTAPAAKPSGGGMMMGGGRRPNLKAAPAEGRVAAITHCGDTYTVKTADGKTQKVWEFNLRFKTDSSADGPAPGKPVIVGAGMQGDRASVVFAAPGEISGFIKQRCE